MLRRGIRVYMFTIIDVSDEDAVVRASINAVDNIAGNQGSVMTLSQVIKLKYRNKDRVIRNKNSIYRSMIHHNVMIKQGWMEFDLPAKYQNLSEYIQDSFE